MTNVSKCDCLDCACNNNGECEQTFGIELDEDRFCTSYEPKDDID